MTTALRLNILRTIFLLICLAAIAALIHPAFAQDLPANRQDASTDSTIRKDAVKEKVETRKAVVAEKITAMKEKMASKEAALKMKLEAFKDKRKAEIADRVNTTLNRINQNQTAQMLRHLDLMTSLLNKLEARVSSGSPDIKDPTKARAAIADARAKISATTAAVTAQAGKDYTLTITSESKVRTDAQSVTDQLKKDLQAVRRQVIDTKQSVANAIRVAKSGKEATPSAKEATASGKQ